MPATSRTYAVTRWLVLAAAILQGCATIDVSGEKLEYSGSKHLDELNASEDALRSILQESKFKLHTTKLAQRDNWEVVTTFVHVSDVQLRDAALHYNRGLVRWGADALSHGAERPRKLDGHDDYPFIALVGAINASQHRKRPDPDVPEFVVHTGDSVDVSTTGELLRFLDVANHLDVPWLQVMGNHDSLVWGNFFKSFNVRPSHDDLEFIRTKGHFIELHGRTTRVGLPDAYVSHAPTENGNLLFEAGMRRHGFGVAPTRNGFYSVTVRSNPRLRLIVLDTVADSETIPKTRLLTGSYLEHPGPGAVGLLDAEQLDWLRQEIADARVKGEGVLVFGHHPLLNKGRYAPDLIARDPISSEWELLVSNELTHVGNDQVLGYFGGHTHAPHYIAAGVPGAPTRLDDAKFVEVIAPSLHEAPQFAFLVNILRDKTEPGKLAIAVRPVRGEVDPGTSLSKILWEECNAALADPDTPASIRNAYPNCWVPDDNVFGQPMLAGRVASVPHTNAVSYRVAATIRPTELHDVQTSRSVQANFVDPGNGIPEATMCPDDGLSISDFALTATPSCSILWRKVLWNPARCMRLTGDAIACDDGTAISNPVGGVLTMTQKKEIPLEAKTYSWSKDDSEDREPLGDILTFEYPDLDARTKRKWQYQLAIKITEGGKATDIVMYDDDKPRVRGPEASMAEELSGGSEVGYLRLRFPATARWWLHT